MPPVSITIKRRLSWRASPYLRSRVSPGKSVKENFRAEAEKLLAERDRTLAQAQEEASRTIQLAREKSEGWEINPNRK